MDSYQLLIWIFLGIIILYILLSISKAKSLNNYLYSKNKLMTEREIKFYKTLKPITDKLKLTVFVKVRLCDIVKPKDNIKNWTACFNKIKSKHVDFIICDNFDLTPIMIIELDDSTHDKKNRIERDLFVDNIFKQVNIPIKHYRQYDYITIENDIKNTLK